MGGEHVILHLEELTKSENGGTKSASSLLIGSKQEEEKEDEPLIQLMECRICQEEDHITRLEAPCGCSGSLKYAHRACVQRWCNEKGDTNCEICHEDYKPGYTVVPRASPNETTIDISSGGWTITSAPLGLHGPRVIAMHAAQHHFLESDYDEYAATSAAGSVAFYRSAAMILMVLLLTRHSLAITNEDEDDDVSTIFSLFLLRTAGFLLPCYVMAWALNILQRRRQRQEAATLAAREVSFILQSGLGGGLQFSIAPELPTTPQQEPHH